MHDTLFLEDGMLTQHLETLADLAHTWQEHEDRLIKGYPAWIRQQLQQQQRYLGI